MSADARPLTVPDLVAMKAAGRRIVMLTCYDAAFARLLEQADVDVLLAVFRRLLAAGHSIVAVEHNTAFLARADHLIELGPDGGPAGGRMVFEGSPAALAARGGTPTAAALSGRVQFRPR